TNGGAIYAETGKLSITNSTISGNSTVGDGGGLYQYAGGAGAITTINNSTIANNQATGPSSRGGGIRLVNGTLKLGNSIVSGNTVQNNPSVASDCAADAGHPVTSQDYNILGVSEACALSGTTTGNPLDTDELLGPFADNGGQ